MLDLKYDLYTKTRVRRFFWRAWFGQLQQRVIRVPEDLLDKADETLELELPTYDPKYKRRFQDMPREFARWLMAEDDMVGREMMVKDAKRGDRPSMPEPEPDKEFDELAARMGGGNTLGDFDGITEGLEAL